jgi:hypothetical protein
MLQIEDNSSTEVSAYALPRPSLLNEGPAGEHAIVELRETLLIGIVRTFG